MEKILFYIFSAILLFAASMVITVRNPIQATLFLILAFFTSAAIWLLLEAEFLAIILVLVYIGAVMVLFLFVVMMLDINLVSLREGFIKYLPVGFIVSALTAFEMMAVLKPENFGLSVPVPTPHDSNYSNTEELGNILYTVYSYPFELAAAILLIAIVAAITLTLRRGTNKHQDPSQQVQVNPKDRVRLVKMTNSETRK
ncbi:NADH-quinone oxidoreductase subunit J [Candidatus Nitrosacidococcus sp. I8]|uniref:NADH-quinone oxidoreductase subunit J n=1 Tax=Candidatus Nitrosacidococcus sp. I8 TaxID=2942908 RepID=UPI0022270977|nr:NADH-quinone oxidoreductase subunit J [Candidatus Nitrosacidococcus sp. I8]CAH9016576.1 NADH-quinone oxidoreductase subunit J [Candidatus Nitrosacidococcus sp. I8]